MHLLAALTTILLTFAPSPTSALVGKGIGKFLACHNLNYTGQCHMFEGKRDKCHNIPEPDPKKPLGVFRNPPPWTSVTPMPDDDQYCYFFDEKNCFGNFLELSAPGSKNLRGLRFDNVIRSWNCWPASEKVLKREEFDERRRVRVP